jgi:hypothetical protein
VGFFEILEVVGRMYRNPDLGQVRLDAEGGKRTREEKEEPLCGYVWIWNSEQSKSCSS